MTPLCHPQHRAVFALNRIKYRQLPRLQYSKAGRYVRWRLMLDSEQVGTGLELNGRAAKKSGGTAKRNWVKDNQQL